MKNQITDIFFDLDHTLWDFDANSELAFRRIFEKDFPSIETKRFLEVYIPINRHCWNLYEIDAISHAELRYNRLRQSFDALEVDINDEQIEQIADQYISFLPDFNHLFEDALETLDYLKQSYRLSIITNGFAEVQFRKIHNSNLTDYFTTITSSETAGAKKPNPEIFKHALDLAGATKENSVMIGDSLNADIKGALDFGMRAIFFNPNALLAPENIIQITTLAALKTIF